MEFKKFRKGDKEFAEKIMNLGTEKEVWEMLENKSDEELEKLANKIGYKLTERAIDAMMDIRGTLYMKFN